MDKFVTRSPVKSGGEKKRKLEDEGEGEAPTSSSSSSSTSKRVATEEKPYLVVLPGAGGVLGKTLLTLLTEDHAIRSKYEIRLPEAGFSWNKFAAGSAANVTAVNKLCEGVGSRDLFVMANSFGNRVLAEMLSASSFTKPTRRVMMCGYPLYQDDKPDRLNQLKKVPEGTDVLFVSGDKDEFLNRSFMAVKGSQALRDAVGSAPCAASSRCEFLVKGKHTCPDAGGKQDSANALAKLKTLILSLDS